MLPDSSIELVSRQLSVRMGNDAAFCGFDIGEREEERRKGEGMVDGPEPEALLAIRVFGNGLLKND